MLCLCCVRGFGMGMPSPGEGEGAGALAVGSGAGAGRGAPGSGRGPSDCLQTPLGRGHHRVLLPKSLGLSPFRLQGEGETFERKAEHLKRSPAGRVTRGALSSGWGRGPQAAQLFVWKDLCGHWVTDSSLSPAWLSSLHRLSFCPFPFGILKPLLLTKSRSPLPPGDRG